VHFGKIQMNVEENRYIFTQKHRCSGILVLRRRIKMPWSRAANEGTSAICVGLEKNPVRPHLITGLAHGKGHKRYR
jgi:hypothetical protein